MRNATAIAMVAISLLMGGAGLTYHVQGEASHAAHNWMVHTHEVIIHIQSLANKVADSEKGVRGYIISGNDIYLEYYRRGLTDSTDPRSQVDEQGSRSSIREELEVLRRLTSDNPVQQNNVEELATAIKALQDYQAAAIETRKKSGFAANWKQNSYQPKEFHDHVQRVIGVLITEENRLLTLRVQADEAAAHQNGIVVYSAIGTFYAVMIFFVWFYQRARAKAQTELANYTHQLERSEEELKMQQEELKASNEEIEASNEELEEQNAQIRQQSEELERGKKLLEEKAGELELASKYKSEFLANMSHELRTPLNSLLILARSLAGNEVGNLTEEQVEEARIIHNGGLELLGLINDILDLSKVEAGKLNIAIEEVLLGTIVKKLRQQFEPVAGEKKVAFNIEVEEGLPVTLHTDIQRVEQILKNLLSNAFKFTEKGSVTLKIGRPTREVALQRAGLDGANAIAFSVVDTGIGIESSKLKDIFEAFQQEDGSIDRHYGGTGLGLTIARKFAHLLGGEIHVTSAKGKGSAFTLVLPEKMVARGVADGKEENGDYTVENTRIELKDMPRSSVAEFIADDRKTIDSRDKVLLIIEDDAGFARTLMKIASRRGYKCLAAGDGKSGILLAVEYPVTAIILDLKLPDIDGMQVLDQLKHDLRSRHIPVHIITGRDESSNVTSLRKGAIGYLTKPVAQEGIESAFTRMEDMLQSEMKRVLVIEDDRKSQVAIQSLLGKKDISLTLADTGRAAFAQVKDVRFDCIILDLRLPDMTGFEWLEKAEGQEINLPPIIVYTAKDLTEEENRRLNHYTGNIIIKGAKSPERLLDEVTLFLHSVESTLSKDQQEMIRMQHNPDKVLQGRTVLLTDDDLRNTFALSRLLKKHGMNVVIADNGQMALDRLKEDPSIELVIMDVMMPVMDGYQAMREIRRQPACQMLPIVALTARAMPEEQEKCMAAGANDYLTKPVDVERLLTLLRVWLFRQEVAA